MNFSASARVLSSRNSAQIDLRRAETFTSNLSKCPSHPFLLKVQSSGNFDSSAEKLFCSKTNSGISNSGFSRVNTRAQSKDVAYDDQKEILITDEFENLNQLLNSTPINTYDVNTKEWIWNGYKIRYQEAGNSGPSVLLIHGFGANCDHWRKNISVLAEDHRVYAIDLLGYGYSEKPSTAGLPVNSIYTFENWSRQILDFIDQVIGSPSFLICNSVGGIVGLQAALDGRSSVKGLLLLNISLRMLHIKKQQWFAKPFVAALQYTLRNTNIGQQFFASVAKPQAVKNILKQCYCDESAVTDELVDVILKPGLLPGAVDVFLDFICYSGGPLPEEMLPLVQCPVVIGWGEEDPWEPIKLGRVYGEFSTVDEFVVLPSVGHCPQDEAPHLVNPLIKKFVSKYV